MGRRFRLRLAGLVALVGLVGVGVVSPAQAEGDLSSGLWYFERGNVQAAHDAGFSGQGVKIAVIDSQINPDIAPLRNANITVAEPAFCRTAEGGEIPAVSADGDLSDHGTGVVSLIAGTGETEAGQVPIRGVAPSAQVLYYTGLAATRAERDAGELKCFDESGVEDTMGGVGRAVDAAIDDGADIISISISGDSSGLYDPLTRALAKGIILVGGLSNSDGVGSGVADTNGGVAVQAFDQDLKIQKGTGWVGGDPSPNTSKDVVVAAPGLGIIQPSVRDGWRAQYLGSGTSLATPIVAGFLAVVKSKYPKATNNQILQTMLHNTNGKKSDTLTWGNNAGYGAISLTSMLADDPLSYPDKNPLFDNPQFPRKRYPTAEDVAVAGGADPPWMTPKPTETSSPSGALDGEGLSALMGAGAWAGGLVVVGGVTALIIVLVVRRRRVPVVASVSPGGHRLPEGVSGSRESVD